MIALGLIRRKQLHENHVFTTGRVAGYSVGGRGNGGGIWIDYTFRVNGKKHKSSSRYLSSDIKSGAIGKYLYPRSFPVAYNPNHPSASRILITPDDFRDLGYTFPDSLAWVKEFVLIND
jgi:hypothetical protein